MPNSELADTRGKADGEPSRVPTATWEHPGEVQGGWAPSPKGMKTRLKSWKGMQPPSPIPAPFASVSFVPKALCSSTPKSTSRDREQLFSVPSLHNAKIKPWHNIILAICSEIMLPVFRMLIMGSGGIFSGPSSNVIKLNIHASEGN